MIAILCGIGLILAFNVLGACVALRWRTRCLRKRRRALKVGSIWTGLGGQRYRVRAFTEDRVLFDEPTPRWLEEDAVEACSIEEFITLYDPEQANV